MRKDNTIQLRISSDHKETMQAWAQRLGITLSDLYSILAYQAGPHQLVKLVTSEYGHKTLSRLGLPPEGLEIIQSTKEGILAFGRLMIYSSRSDIAEALGDTRSAQAMRKNAEVAEASLYRAYGKATKEQPAPGHHVTDAF